MALIASSTSCIHATRPCHAVLDFLVSSFLFRSPLIYHQGHCRIFCFLQMRPSGLSQSSAHTSKPNMYDGGAFSSLRPISAFNAQSMANPAFTHRVPLSSTERGMLSKPSIETMATSNSNLTASSYPHLSQYASQASLGQPSFYDAEVRDQDTGLMAMVYLYTLSSPLKSDICKKRIFHVAPQVYMVLCYLPSINKKTSFALGRSISCCL